MTTPCDQKIKVSINIRRVAQLFLYQSADLYKCCGILHQRKYLHYLVLPVNGWMNGWMVGWMGLLNELEKGETEGDFVLYSYLHFKGTVIVVPAKKIFCLIVTDP